MDAQKKTQEIRERVERELFWATDDSPLHDDIQYLLDRVERVETALRKLHAKVGGTLQGYGILEPEMAEAERLLSEVEP